MHPIHHQVETSADMHVSREASVDLELLIQVKPLGKATVCFSRLPGMSESSSCLLVPMLRDPRQAVVVRQHRFRP